MTDFENREGNKITIAAIKGKYSGLLMKLAKPRPDAIALGSAYRSRCQLCWLSAAAGEACNGHGHCVAAIQPQAPLRRDALCLPWGMAENA